MGRGARDGKTRSLLRAGALLVALVRSASPVGAADQLVLGKSFVVKDPSPGYPSRRLVAAYGKERTSSDTIVGDPVTSGATIEIVANGATSTDQLFVLPPG